MTTPDQTRTAEVDPLVLTAPAAAGQRVGAFAVDVLPPLALLAIAAVMFAIGQAALGWIAALLAVAAVAAALAMLARTGRSPGGIAAGTRTVDRLTGAAPGTSLLAALFTGRLRQCDLRRGRDPFAPALAPFVFPEPEAAPVTPARGGMRGVAPVVQLDSGQRFSLDSALVLGRNPSAPRDAPSAVYQWADLSRTLSKSHARLEWDGQLVWVTDLASTNGTALRTGGAAQPLLPYQRTPLPPDAVLELGDRVVTVKVAA
ncbi:FHA domain-containing protein [Microbacterium sp. M3]|uniref:FHA domain-containing protein n=1 Tax=Microbacterium arthrosphaerae TaxID=792652 RepID=A0ABU4H3U8_9MICO|nr:MULTISPECIES: FHA domain-containing protein [Microbacterium]MDW4574015.1 FHA domain-containing protein [Microbacterium arthrosphaerae]MDW7607870.1 FHA domain-containing protein [Microbacterium sp. M3]